MVEQAVVREDKSMSSYEGEWHEYLYPICAHFRLTFARSHIDERYSKTSKMSLGGAMIKIRNEFTKGTLINDLLGAC